MHNTQIRLIAALLTATSGFGWAQTGPIPPIDGAACPPASHGAAAVVPQRGFTAQYELTNGRQLALSAFGDGLLLSYHQGFPTLLRHDGQGNFLSRDGLLVLRFEADMNGASDRLHLQAPADWL